MAGVLVVTGGSRGIGAATALLAAQRGWDVLLTYRTRADEADAVVAACVDAGARAAAVRADVTSEADVVAAFAAARELGIVTGVVNNAGIVDRLARVEDLSVERLQRMFAVNITGAFVCAREAVRVMARSRGGTGGAIVNVSSRAAVLGGAGSYVDYAASKGAIDVLTVGLAAEVASEGIRVNGVRPGLIETEIHADTGLPDRVARLSPGGAAGPRRHTRRGRRRDRLAAVRRGLLRDRRHPGRQRRTLRTR